MSYEDEENDNFTEEELEEFASRGTNSQHRSLNSLKNLKKLTKESIRNGNIKASETMRLRKDLKEDFRHINAVLTDLNEDTAPLDGLSVIKLAIMRALANDDTENAAKWATVLVEYQKPKLARVENHIIEDVKDISDEELRARAVAEGLILPTTGVMQ